MFNIMKDLAGKAAESITSTATSVGDFVTGKDAQDAADWIKKTAFNVGDEAVRMGTEVVQSDLVQDAGKGALVGAVVAVPLPIIGPAIGASIGASVGVYKNLTKKPLLSIGAAGVLCMN
jgi:hypothetical protein